MLVWMKNKQGTWSEAVLAKGSTIVLGYARVHSVVVKNQSSCSGNGTSCILDQVYYLPFKGNSTRPRCPIISLKRKISFMLPPGLFLLSTDLMKLKSPRRSSSPQKVFAGHKTSEQNHLSKAQHKGHKHSPGSKSLHYERR